jgi:hypothetical protein
MRHARACFGAKEAVVRRVQNLRRVLAAALVVGVCFLGVSPAPAIEQPTIELIPEVDLFGTQVETIQTYEDPATSQSWMMFGIYDTGASVLTMSAVERYIFDLLNPDDPFPVKVPEGALAQGIGGDLIGDVSPPGTVTAYGLSALSITSLDDLLDPTLVSDQFASVEGAQMFVGIFEDGKSPALPSITGTPIHNPSPTHAQGSAARIEMQAFPLDFGQLFPGMGFDGIVIHLPDVKFEDRGAVLEPAVDGSTYDPVRIPVTLFGVDNHLNPGDDVTASPNPVVPGVDLVYTDAAEQTRTVSDRTLLFDTGAQLSVISEAIAADLGIDLALAEYEIDVQGAAGTAMSVKGYVLDSLEMPRDDGQMLRFEQVPVFVLDLGIEGLDGILGMNLMNPAHTVLYDPFDPEGPSVSLTFLQERLDGFDADELAAIEQLKTEFPAFAETLIGQNLPGFEIVPEPPALALLALGGLVGLVWVRRRAYRVAMSRLLKSRR